MLRDEAIADMRDILGFRTDTENDAKYENALQRAQVKLENAGFLPWFLKTEIADKTTTANEERVKLPSNFLREFEEDPLWWYDAAAANEADVWTPLGKHDLAFLRRNLPGTGKPKGYAIDALYFRILPVPDDAYVLRMIYHKKDVALTSNVENQWLKYAPDWLIGVAGQTLAVGIKNKDALEVFRKMEIETKAEIIRATAARNINSRRPVMGGED